MAFNQFTLDRSVNQSRGIFDKYVYKTGDLVEDVITPGYFSQSRFIGNDWEGSIIECQCSNGYIIGEITLDGQSIEVIYNSISNIETYVIDANRTTQGSEVIICRNTTSIEVTLNASPQNKESITVKRKDAAVRVNGDIDGQTFFDIGGPQNALVIIYVAEDGEWSIV